MDRIYAVDLFCGIGGLTKGLEEAGIKVVAGIDNDKNCEYAYQTNNHAKFYCRNIEDVDGDFIKRLYPHDTVHALVGCAPCQPFSRYSLRYRKDGRHDDKWKLLNEFGRLIKETAPDIVSMENVPSLRNEKVFQDFLAILYNGAYDVDYHIVYCPDYGVPQKRKRLVLLASRIGEIKLIDPIYKIGNYKTVRNAIGSLPPLSAGQTDPKDRLHTAGKLSEKNMFRIQNSKPGGSWKDWDKSLQLKCHKKKSGQTYGSVYGRMEWDEPSPTITTQFYGYGNGRFGHPEQDRAITLREGALLQSFPYSYKFVKDGEPVNKRELGIHIGNAVPVELGKAIGISIRKSVEEE
jgi:DNA (cytosine-5)-methyltransferase 1